MHDNVRLIWKVWTALIAGHTGLFVANAALADCQPAGAAPFCLAGTVTAPGIGAAVIEEAGKPGLDEVHEGDALNDWTVTTIGQRFVTLQHEEQSIRLGLRGEMAPPAAPLHRPPLGYKDPRLARGEQSQPPRPRLQVPPEKR